MTEFEAYLWATPNSRRVTIMLEELGLSYKVHPVNIRAGDQRKPGILALNPYGRVPILTWREDGEPRVLIESGAILIALAERFDRFLPRDGRARDDTLAWLMVVLTSLAPLSGQAHHWTSLASEKPEAAVRHHVGLVARTYHVLDERLAGQAYLAGDTYSIADIAAYPWIERISWTSLDPAGFPAIARWAATIAARPAVVRGMGKPNGIKLEG